MTEKRGRMAGQAIRKTMEAVVPAAKASPGRRSSAAIAPPEPAVRDRPAAVDHGLDKIDLDVIACLQEDGRMPYVQIGERVGLSEAAARQRVNRLQEAGVVSIVGIVDPIKLGLRVVAIIGIRVQGDAREVARRLAEVGDVEYVVLLAGPYDLMIEIVCEDEHRLLEIVNGDVRPIEGIVSTEMMIVLKIEKQIFNWGMRSARNGLPLRPSRIPAAVNRRRAPGKDGLS